MAALNAAVSSEPNRFTKEVSATMLEETTNICSPIGIPFETSRRTNVQSTLNKRNSSRWMHRKCLVLYKCRTSAKKLDACAIKVATADPVIPSRGIGHDP